MRLITKNIKGYLGLDKLEYIIYHRYCDSVANNIEHDTFYSIKFTTIKDILDFFTTINTDMEYIDMIKYKFELDLRLIKEVWFEFMIKKNNEIILIY